MTGATFSAMQPEQPVGAIIIGDRDASMSQFCVWLRGAEEFGHSACRHAAR
jgi:hypothetical protein